MKKIATLLSLATVLVACNRESDDVVNSGPQNSASAGVVHYEASDLPGSLQNMNESFSVSSKAAGPQLNYTYRGYAKPVDADGTPFNADDLAASAIFSVDDVVFVCWHTNDNGGGNTLGASIAAYKLSGIGQYTFMDRVDYPNHDFFKMAASKNSLTGNIEVMVAGQRDPDNSGYLLTNHTGATITRIDYDYINDEFWEPSFQELPLPGEAATDVIALAGQYYVLTGNGTGSNSGGLFEVDRALQFVKKADQGNIEDGIALAVDPTTVTPTSGNLYVLDRAGVEYRVQTAAISAVGATSTFTSVSPSSDNNGGSPITPINFERGDLQFAQGPGSTTDTDSLLIAVGSNGLFEANSGAGQISQAVDQGACTGIAFDAGIGVLYYSAGESGIWVLAMGEYASASGPLVNLYDNVGRFTPPTSVGGIAGPIPFNIKDVSVYQGRNIALCSGDGGVFFIQKDK
ncbi:MAG: hypothetical protein ACPGVV_03365 [Croceimicrobium sp.]